MIHATFNRAVIDIFNDQTSREIFESAIIIDDYVTHLSVLDNSISRIIFFIMMRSIIIWAITQSLPSKYNLCLALLANRLC